MATPRPAAPTGENEPEGGVSVLRPRARILRTLGDELISSERVALIELVKNSYDADASEVVLRFTPPLIRGAGGIDVIDNGHGMTLGTIQETWMEPATLHRLQQKQSEGKKRRVLGEKGIGRFAASRLADDLEVITWRGGSAREIHVDFDWSDFDDPDKYLDQVEARWRTSSPSDIPSHGYDHGTVLSMRRLRADWSDEDFQELRTSLARLLLPAVASRDKFKILLQAPDESVSGDVEPPEALHRPHYSIRGKVKADGSYSLTIETPGQPSEKLNDRFVLPSGRRPATGPFEIELRVWDLDAEAWDDDRKVLRDFRRDLGDVAGISVYRDGFRVLPYGEPRNDWLRLDLRRVQNPTMRLSNNQILGSISVSADKNPGLRDQTNREGLMERPELADLRQLVLATLALLEKRRYAVRPRRGRDSKGSLFAGLNLRPLQEYVEVEHPNDEALRRAVASAASDLSRTVSDVQDVLARYRRLATLGQLIDTVLHDGRQPVAKIKNSIELGLRTLDREDPCEPTTQDGIRSRMKTVAREADVLAGVFRRIEPFGGRKRGRPADLVLEHIIKASFDVYQAELKRLKVSVDIPETTTTVRIDPSEFEEVIVNLLSNSLYWLGLTEATKRAISVTIARVTEGVEVVFSDSGPGVDPDDRDRIFDPYFSTKPTGVGLGLAIAGEIVKDFYDGELELVDGGTLPGATFRMLLRRRV